VSSNVRFALIAVVGFVVAVPLVVVLLGPMLMDAIR
jgi:hypothetical protein